jgi:hypothetical protein
MALSASSIAKRAATILIDLENTRWTASELVQWLNDAQRELVAYRPDATAQYLTVTLTSGTRQSLDVSPESAAIRPFKLLDVVRNMAVTSQLRAIRQTSRDMLDAWIPDWHTAPASVDIVNFMYDHRSPRTFYVYPPALPAAQVEVLMSNYLVDIATPSGDYTTIVGTIAVSDIFSQALVDYILYRAFLKDSDFAANSQRAAAYYASFTNLLGTEVKGTLSTSPSISAGANNTASPE